MARIDVKSFNYRRICSIVWIILQVSRIVGFNPSISNRLLVQEEIRCLQSLPKICETASWRVFTSTISLDNWQKPSFFKRQRLAARNVCVILWKELRHGSHDLVVVFMACDENVNTSLGKDTVNRLEGPRIALAGSVVHSQRIIAIEWFVSNSDDPRSETTIDTS